ncbi:MAG: transposase [Tissierellaceae bacterium]|nr:transposase [Tissierellaceae bacterium]
MEELRIFRLYDNSFYAIFEWGDTMARYAREKSSTGIYHVMLRGIDKRNIFMDEEDREKFVDCIIKAKRAGNFELYAYCLMDNHVHLLIKEDEEIGTSIKRITVGYVSWHNKKHERTGHLFQNRFRSESVETESYLVTVLRYIHQNPLKAGMVRELKDYEWSSYNQYLFDYGGEVSFIDTELIRSYFPTIDSFVNHMSEKNNDECLEYKVNRSYNDDTIKKMIQNKYDIDNLIKLPLKERNGMIKKIYNEFNISLRQLSRALDMGKAVIERAIKQ